jgi:hypothetical protein
MDDETPTIELPPTQPVPAPSPPAHRPRWRRALAVAAGVAMVPALYAVATAATGGGDASTPSTVAAARHGADDVGTETEVEHGVVVEKPHGGAVTPSVPEATTPTTPDVTTPTAPDATTPTLPENEIEHPVPEPGDDNGHDGRGDGGAVTQVPAGTQAFSSVGGSIVVAVNGSSLSLVSTSPAAGYTAEVHDSGPGRVEVRFSNGGTEWRIRVELGGGGLVPEITQHG